LALADGTDETCPRESTDVVPHDTANFIAQVFDGVESWVPQAQTRRAMQLCLAASESVRTGRKIEVA